jgi:bifunctional oligoribonuclease and PAP phosphatase NrnA
MTPPRSGIVQCCSSADLRFCTAVPQFCSSAAAVPQFRISAVPQFCSSAFLQFCISAVPACHGRAAADRVPRVTHSERPGSMMHDLLAVPDHRRDPLLELLDILDDAANIVLTTHVNADGDGAGSQTALAAWLLRRGKDVGIANPTGFPRRFAYLVPHRVAVLEPGSAMDTRVRNADVVLVVDTGEPRRIGRVAKHLPDERVIVLDHHPPAEDGIPDRGCETRRRAPRASWSTTSSPLPATTWGPDHGPGRLCGHRDRYRLVPLLQYDASPTPSPPTCSTAASIPKASTGASTPPCPSSGSSMIRLSLDHLETDPDLPITWITVPREVTHEMGADPDDLDDVADYARNVQGTEVAITFRETLDGATKISFRSNGDIDVNAIAREFGGGGHVKAAGALLSGPVETTRPRVLDAVRRPEREPLAAQGVMNDDAQHDPAQDPAHEIPPRMPPRMPPRTSRRSPARRTALRAPPLHRRRGGHRAPGPDLDLPAAAPRVGGNGRGRSSPPIRRTTPSDGASWRPTTPSPPTPPRPGSPSTSSEPRPPIAWPAWSRRWSNDSRTNPPPHHRPPASKAIQPSGTSCCIRWPSDT